MKRKITAFLLIAAFFVFLGSPVLLSRAGGGESYGGGGGGGGSFGGGGSGGGGGGGELIVCLIWLIIKYPCIGIPLTLFIIAAAIFSKVKTSGAITDRKLKKSTRAVRNSTNDSDIARLKMKDEKFSLEALKTRISTAFVAVQNAWSAQDLKKVVPFISDGVNERFSLQIQMQKAEGWRNIMENVTVRKVELIALSSDDYFDTLHFAITAKAKDYKKDLKTGKTLPGSTVTETFTEIWTFLRKADVKTLSGKGAFEGNCPNCAAPLEITDAGKCKACNAFIRSPAYDWILSEITQEEEWEPQKTQVTALQMELITSKDPNFSVQYIEDRASVVFYRYQAALFSGDSLHLRKVASPESYKELEAQINAGRKGDTLVYYRFPAVGKVETIWIQSNDKFDKIHVLVKWSGSLAERNLSTGRIKQTGPRTIRSTVFTLFRRSDAFSPSGSFSSSHCPNCGAPELRDASDVCPYCGTVLNDGSRAWILGEIKDFYSWSSSNRARWDEDRRRANTDLPQNPSAVIEALAAMMFADGVADQKERKKLAEFASKHGVPLSQTAEIVERVENGNHVWQIPSDKVRGSAFLSYLMDMALSDGRVSHEEWKMLKEAAYKIGIGEETLKKQLRDRQKALINFGKSYFKNTNEDIAPPPPPDFSN